MLFCSVLVFVFETVDSDHGINTLRFSRTYIRIGFLVWTLGRDQRASAGRSVWTIMHVVFLPPLVVKAL